MNIHFKAAAKTVFMILTCFSAVAITGLAMHYIPLETLANIGSFLLLGFLVYVAYSINLGQLKYEEKLKELDNSLKNVKFDK